MHITKLKTDNLEITSSPYLEPELLLIRDKHTSATSVTNPPDLSGLSWIQRRKQHACVRACVHTHTHTHEKHSDHNPFQGLPGTYTSSHGMFIFKINAIMATILLTEDYMPLCSKWQRYASKYFIKSALSVKTGMRFTFLITHQLKEGCAVKGKQRNNSWFPVWKCFAILLVWMSLKTVCS